MITHLEIRDVRGFAKLDLKGLQRVNLIVGKNNCGKTSLLEAVVIACDPKRAVSDLPGLLRVHPGNVDNYYRWIVRDGAQEDSRISRGPVPGGLVLMAGRGRRLVEGDKKRYGEKIYESGALQVATGRDFHAVRCRVVSVQQRDPSSLVQLFDRAMIRKGGEEAIENMLRNVDPRLKKIRMRAPQGEQAFIEVDLGLSERLPLAQTGQGISRLVAVFSELVGEAPDVCIIDEIENGIHHTLLPQVWQGIAVAARELNVQVFATTHSHECIEAAHEAMSTQPSYDFGIIQLFRSDTNKALEVQGRVLDRRLIEAALQGDVDLR